MKIMEGRNKVYEGIFIVCLRESLNKAAKKLRELREGKTGKAPPNVDLGLTPPNLDLIFDPIIG